MSTEVQIAIAILLLIPAWAVTWLRAWWPCRCSIDGGIVDSVARPSLTVDSLNPGSRYAIFIEQTFGAYKVISCGSFEDEFEGLFLQDKQLYANFAKQGAVDCRSITRIEVR